MSLIIPIVSTFSNLSTADADSANDGNVAITLAAQAAAGGGHPGSLAPGDAFVYRVDATCQLTTCGAATMTLDLPDGIVLLGDPSAPTGAILAAGWGDAQVAWSTTLTRASAIVWYLNVQVDPNAPVTLNGQAALASAQLTTELGGGAAGTTPVDLSATDLVTLSVAERAALTATADSFNPTTFVAKSGEAASFVVSGTQGANTAGSSLTFETTTHTAGAVLLFEAFDLNQVQLSSNPAGATVLFQVDGTWQATAQPVAAGVLLVDAPTGVTNYKITFADVANGDTIAVTSNLTLRDALRSNPASPVTSPSTGASTIDAAMKVTSTTPGTSSPASTLSQTVFLQPKVNAAPVRLDATSFQWLTESNDAVSIMGTDEATTMVAKAANTTASPWTSMSVTLPGSLQGMAVEKMTGAPAITCPAGATTYTVQYAYGLDTAGGVPLGVGQPQTAPCGATTPGLDTTNPAQVPANVPLNWDIVTQVTVSFDNVMPGCDGVGASCAATVSVPTALRLGNSLNGFAFDGPSISTYFPATAFQAYATIAVHANDGSVGSTQTNNAILWVAVPNYKVGGTKAILGAKANSAMTGQMSSGDYADNITDHQLVFTIGAQPANPGSSAGAPADSDKTLGPKTLTLTDPSEILSAAGANDASSRNTYRSALLNSTGNLFWNSVQLASIPTKTDIANSVSCTSPSGLAIPSFTVAANAYTLIATYNPYTPGSIRAGVALDTVTDPATVVGLDYSIAAIGDARFPVDVQCTITGLSVTWRATRIADNQPVAPVSVVNTATAVSDFPATGADASTTVNIPFYTGKMSAPMTLVTHSGGSAIKAYATAPGTALTATTPMAASYGIQGQNQPTAFVVSGSVGGVANATTLQVTDGSTTKTGGYSAGNSLDVFALTGIRGAYLGPAQTMAVSLADDNGNLLYKLTVTTPSLCTDGATPCGQDNDSQSEEYLAAYQTPRTWSAGSPSYTWTDATGATMAAQPTPAQLEGVAQVGFTVTSNQGGVLPAYASAKIVIDAALRTKTLHGNAPILGGPNSTPNVVYNAAKVYVTTPSGTTNTGTSSVGFGVVSGGDIQVTGRILWTSNDPSGKFIAGNGTTGLMTLKAYNNSAIDIGGCPAGTPADMVWNCPTRQTQGIDSLTITLGDTTPDPTMPPALGPGSDQNPFAIANFVSFGSLKAPKLQTGNLANVSVTYTYDQPVMPGGTYTETKTLLNVTANQSQGPVPALAPSYPVNVVGMIVTFTGADGALIDTQPPNGLGAYTGLLGSAPSGVNFSTVLRDTVRDGYSYKFGDAEQPSVVAGTGETTIAPYPADPDGALPATAWISASATASAIQPGAVQVSNADSTVVPIVNPLIGGTLTKNNSNSSDTSPLYRDSASARNTTFTVKTTNSGNMSVDQMTIADEACLLGADTSLMSSDAIKANLPANCVLQPGSMFDAFDINNLKVTFPAVVAVGSNQSLTMTASFLIADAAGKLAWYNYTNPYQQLTTLDMSATLDATQLPWDQVVGVVVTVQGNANPASAGPTRIEVNGTLSVDLTASLRLSERTDPTGRAPGDDQLPKGQDHWAVNNTAISAFATLQSGVMKQTWLAPAPVSASAWINPGVPNPLAVESVAPDGVPALSQTLNIAPGNWADFYAGVTNQPGATGALYDATFTVDVPAGLSYNSSGGHTWAPVPRGANIPGLTLVANPVTCTWTDATLTCTVEGAILPGETVLIRLPLQVDDGMQALLPFTSNNVAMGAGLLGETTSMCADPATINEASQSQCHAKATVTTTNSISVRSEKYVSAGRQVVTGANCDAGALASWEAGNSADGSFYRDPCAAVVALGETVTYRLKLTNSGNNDMYALRFVDVLPYLGDTGTLATTARGSQFDISYVPGSLKLVDDLAAGTDNGYYRGDATLTNPQYSTATKPCAPGDAAAGAGVLACGTTWAGTDGADTKSLKGEIAFPDGQALTGGQYVILQYQVIIPGARDGSTLVGGNQIVNDAALSGNSLPNRGDSGWIGASSSTPVAAQLGTVLVITKQLNRPTDITVVGDFDFSVACTLNGNPVRLDPADSAFTLVFGRGDAEKAKTISGLPVGAVCVVAETSAGGADATLATGGVPGQNAAGQPTATVTIGASGPVNVAFGNTFTPAELDLTATAQGSAVDVGAPWVPDVWTVHVHCDRTGLVIGGVGNQTAVDFDGDVTLTSLLVDQSAVQSVVPVPVGSVCAITVPNSRGAVFYTITAGSPTGNTVDTTTHTNEDVSYPLRGYGTQSNSQGYPTIQANLVFDYEIVRVHLDEVVKGAAPVGVKLPFAVTATYVDEYGDQQTFALPNDGRYALGGGGATEFWVPVDATVTITQTDQKGSESVTTTQDGATVSQASITLATTIDDVGQSVMVTFTNTWIGASTGGALAGSNLAAILAAMVAVLAGAVILIRRKKSYIRN